jgi:hypothetical protein
VSKRFRAVLQRAKLPPVPVKDLRHTFATDLLEVGAPITYEPQNSGIATRPLRSDTMRTGLRMRTGFRAVIKRGLTCWRRLGIARVVAKR